MRVVQIKFLLSDLIDILHENLHEWEPSELKRSLYLESCNSAEIQDLLFEISEIYYSLRKISNRLDRLRDMFENLRIVVCHIGHFQPYQAPSADPTVSSPESSALWGARECRERLCAVFGALHRFRDPMCHSFGPCFKRYRIQNPRFILPPRLAPSRSCSPCIPLAWFRNLEGPSRGRPSRGRPSIPPAWEAKLVGKLMRRRRQAEDKMALEGAS